MKQKEKVLGARYLVLAAALVAAAGVSARASEEESVVAFAEAEFWLGPDEIVEATAEMTFWLGPGCENCPWTIGEGVTAYLEGGTLVIAGAGEVTSTPWTEFTEGIAKLQVAEGVTDLGGTTATLPNLASVNGLSLGAFNSAAVGAVKAAGFNAIAVENGEATLTLVVKKAATVDAEEKDWTEAATTPVTVRADTPAGFFIVAPAK